MIIITFIDRYTGSPLLDEVTQRRSDGGWESGRIGRLAGPRRSIVGNGPIYDFRRGATDWQAEAPTLSEWIKKT